MHLPSRTRAANWRLSSSIDDSNSRRVQYTFISSPQRRLLYTHTKAYVTSYTITSSHSRYLQIRLSFLLDAKLTQHIPTAGDFYVIARAAWLSSWHNLSPGPPNFRNERNKRATSSLSPRGPNLSYIHARGYIYIHTPDTFTGHARGGGGGGHFLRSIGGRLKESRVAPRVCMYKHIDTTSATCMYACITGGFGRKSAMRM